MREPRRLGLQVTRRRDSRVLRKLRAATQSVRDLIEAGVFGAGMFVSEPRHRPIRMLTARQVLAREISSLLQLLDSLEADSQASGSAAALAPEVARVHAALTATTGALRALASPPAPSEAEGRGPGRKSVPRRAKLVRERMSRREPSANVYLPAPAPDHRRARMPGEVHTTRARRAADLGRAMIQQARLGDAYERAVGTSAEHSAFARLQRAGRELARCDQDVRADRTTTAADAIA